MNLKDRLDSIKNTNSISIKEDIDNSVDLKKLFVSFDEIKEVLNSIIFEKNNVAFIFDSSVDKILRAGLVKSIFENVDIEILNSINDYIGDCFSKIKFLMNTSTYDVVKIFEYIINGDNSFIFNVSIRYDENFIDKLKAVIALNFKNLTEENINTLIGCSNLYVVPVGRNEDGLFVVSEVVKLNYFDKKISLDVIKDIRSELYSKSLSLTDNVLNEFVDTEINEEIASTSQKQAAITYNSVNIQDDSYVDNTLKNNDTIEEVKQEASDNILGQEEITKEQERINTSSNVQLDIIDNSNEEKEHTDINLADGQSANLEEKTAINDLKMLSSGDENFSLKKVNKYKLLREKIRNKRNV